jgi:hypothetical protein
MFVGYNVLSMADTVINNTEMDTMALSYNSTVRFDSDSVPIKIENCCTQTMTGYRDDFIPSTIVAINGKHVTGFAQTKTRISHIGTVKWNITDDQGIQHDICIPNTYYVPESNFRLLSPQHRAQEANNTFPYQDGTWSATYRDRVVVKWNQKKYTKTVTIDPTKGNVATMWTTGGDNRFKRLYNLIKSQTVLYDSELTEVNSVPDNIYQQQPNRDSFHKV